MPRRVTLPGASELFRATESADLTLKAVPSPVEAEPVPAGQASGRVRHDEKITVYVSTQELIALETGRLALRGDHGLAVDRGRLVRESIAIVMADLAAHGADSELVRRLNGQ